MNCKICGKEIAKKIIGNKEICHECIAITKMLDRGKSTFTSKEIIKLIVIIGVLLLLGAMNVCAVITGHTFPAIVATSFIVFFGITILGLISV